MKLDISSTSKLIHRTQEQIIQINKRFIAPLAFPDEWGNQPDMNFRDSKHIILKLKNNWSYLETTLHTTMNSANKFHYKLNSTLPLSDQFFLHAKNKGDLAIKVDK